MLTELPAFARRRHNERFELPDTTTEVQAPERASRPKIRCPRCNWEPDGKPYWQCELCFARFNTSETRARCPTCSNRWRETQCIACHRLSPHENWYADASERNP